MATANEKLAAALEALREVQGSTKRRVFRSNEFSRLTRERLVNAGFLSEVIRGWLYITRPDGKPGDTTPWVASFWEFTSAYANDRFGDEWSLSAEQSLLLATADSSIPKQLLINAPAGTNNVIPLPFGNSILDLKSKLALDQIETVDGIRRMTVPGALTRARDEFFEQQPLAAQLALSSIRSSSQLLAPLLDAGASTIAGRLAGALRHVKKDRLADDIVKTMRQAQYDVRETNPFASGNKPLVLRAGNPLVGRLTGLWQNCRQSVIDEFPEAPGLPGNAEAFMVDVEEIYNSDAYHSLSIEGYSVTPELIERVRSGEWNPENDMDDEESKDALAARGYFDAFQLVKKSLRSILDGGNAGEVVENDHDDWYRALFTPSVLAGLIKARDLAGYRNHPVYLRGSDYVPPRAEVVIDGMSTLFELLKDEPEASVRAVLGHWLFGYIHPYPDGNGRTARFLFNAMLASGGYPWTIVRVDDRPAYLSALDDASIRGNAGPFARLLADQVRQRLEPAPETEPALEPGC